MDSNGPRETTQSMTSDTAGLLPIQYRDTVRPSSSAELRLMAAVLHRAVADFCHHSADQRPVGRHLFRLASEWIASRDVSWPYSFENICRTLDIDAPDLRRALVLQRTRRQSARAKRRGPQTIVLAPREAPTHRVWEPLPHSHDETPRRESEVA